MHAQIDHEATGGPPGATRYDMSAVANPSHISPVRVLSGLALVAALVVFAVSVARSVEHFSDSLGAPFFDWQFYRYAVERWLAGGPIYPGGAISTLGAAAGSSYAYPPASVPLMWIFASYPLGALAWLGLLTSTLLAGLWLIARQIWPRHGVLIFAVIVASLSVVPPVQEGLAVGNVNILTAGLLGIGWTRPVSVQAGIMTVVKVFPFALAAPYGIRALAVAAAVGMGIVAATLPLVGLDEWATYASALGKVNPLCGDERWFNASLACAAEGAVGAELARWVGLAAGAVALCVAVAVGRGLVGSVAVTVAILAPASELHLHYFAIVYVLAWIALAETLKWGNRHLSR